VIDNPTNTVTVAIISAPLLLRVIFEYLVRNDDARDNKRSKRAGCWVYERDYREIEWTFS
jgi:hypothetical protein